VSYYSAILADSPVAFWPLDEASGTTAFDQSGNGFNGAHQNTPTPGILGPIPGLTATDFNEDQTEYTTVATNALMHVANGNNAWSLESWFRSQTFGAGDFRDPAILCPVYDGTRVDFLLGFWNGVGVTNKASVNFFAGGAWQTCLGTTALNDQVWHHLVGTYDGTDLQINVNGNVENTVTTGADPTAGTGDILIARKWDLVTSVHAKLFGLAIYDHKLAQDRIRAHHAESFGPPLRTVASPMRW
jgi:hypothetical protein